MTDDRLREVENLFAQGRAEKARALLLEILEDHPANPRGWKNMGVIQQTLGQSQAAVEAFKKALELAPEDETARSGLAVCLVSLKRWAEARTVLNELVARQPGNPKLWAMLGQAEKELKRPAPAAWAFDQSLALNPNQPALRAARDRLEPLDLYRNAEIKMPDGSQPEVLLCCPDGLTHFAFQLADELDKYARLTRVAGSSFDVFLPAIAQAPVVWLEWGSTLAIKASQTPGLLDGRRAIVRLHSFEILSRIAYQINYDKIDDVIFISHYMKEMFLKHRPDVAGKSRLHVIHNGVDLAKFSFRPGKGRRKIALVGRVEYKKDPMVALQAFAFLHQRRPELELHVAGAMDQDRYHLAVPDMVAKNKLERAVRFYGHVTNIPGWLADKDMIISSSPFEGQGVGIVEAVHSGLRPLIYNFPGADQLFPASWLWNNFDELEKLVYAGPDPAECRDFVADFYSMDRQVHNFLKLLTGSQPVVEKRPVS